jgi:hypothetical protein
MEVGEGQMEARAMATACISGSDKCGREQVRGDRGESERQGRAGCELDVHAIVGRGV